MDRGKDTLVCDLNVEPRPDLSRLGVDTAVFGGVLEYIQNLEALVRWVARDVDRCLVSYECAQTRRLDRGRLYESFTRAQAGWVNTFHEDEFVLLFEREGFLLARRDLWRTKDWLRAYIPIRAQSCILAADSLLRYRHKERERSEAPAKATNDGI